MGKRSNMASITLTIEDKIDGNVRIVSNPTFESMAMKVDSGEDLSAAEVYALYCLRKIREKSKQQDRFDYKIHGV